MHDERSSQSHSEPSSRPVGRGEAADLEHAVEPEPPRGWLRRLLLLLPAALFVFLLSVLIWGILADLLAGY